MVFFAKCKFSGIIGRGPRSENCLYFSSVDETKIRKVVPKGRNKFICKLVLHWKNHVFPLRFIFAQVGKLDHVFTEPQKWTLQERQIDLPVNKLEFRAFANNRKAETSSNKRRLINK